MSKPRSEIFYFISLLLSLYCSACWGDSSNTMSGLREGRVYVYVDDKPETVKLIYRPLYGWDEPVLLFSPDGRVMAKDRFEHKRTGFKVYHLDKGKGVYAFLLKPSYVYTLETSATKMVFSPEPEMPGFYRKISGQSLVFKVPEGTRNFTIFFSNIYKFKGFNAELELLDPSGKTVTRRYKVGMKRDEAMQRLTGFRPEDIKQGQRGSDFAISSAPLEIMGDSIETHDPEPGFWTVRVGTTGLRPYKIGLWLEGIPNCFAGRDKYWFRPEFTKDPVSASIHISAQPLSIRPFLGIVGHMGKPGSAEELTLKALGQRGDKLFLRQDKMIPSAGVYKLPNKCRFSPEHEAFSLIVFRNELSWIRKHSLTERLANWGLWAKKTSEMLLKQTGRKPETFVLQVLNEPNLEISFNEYYSIFSVCARTVKNCPTTSKILFAGPGLGSGEEQGIIDWNWIRMLITEADPLVDLITWNLYRVKNLEDTFLYSEALEETYRIIKENDNDGQIEDIIIGATNREGGWAPDRLFNSWEAALWWASTLTHVINTGKLKAVYYYNIIDKGYGRKKGMIDETLGLKAQAYVNREFSDLLKCSFIHRVTSDHSQLEAVAARKGGSFKLILLNKGWRYISVSIDFPWSKKKSLYVKRLEADGKFSKIPWKSPLTVAPKEILIISG